MPSYHIHRLKDHLRQSFRQAPHVSGTASIKPRDYNLPVADAPPESGEFIEAPTPYAAYFTLKTSPTPLLPGDLLESESGQLRIYKFVGFEEAQWILPEVKMPDSGEAPGELGQVTGSSSLQPPSALPRQAIKWHPMGVRNRVETPVNSFALVSYLPNPLAAFLNDLRHELDPHCQAQAHVTILPPRPLACPADQAWNQLRERLQDFEPLQIELGDVQSFPESQVIYLSVKSGHAALEHMHSVLNVGLVAFDEPYTYHPHITLAQDLNPTEFSRIREWTAQRWAQFAQARTFQMAGLTLVQNSLENHWSDLAEMDLVSHVAR